MNKTIVLLAIAMFFSLSVQAQIKRQYKDNKSTQETVVIKDNKSTSDLDILNTEFDEIGIGEVIRITTETNPAKAALPEQPLKENTMAMVSKPKQTKVKTNPKPQKVEVQSVKTATVPVRKLKERYRGIYPRKSKINLKNPRFKKKKRKQAKRKRNKCYSF